MKDHQLLELTNLLLDAASKPEAWGLVVEKLAELVDAPKGGIEFTDFTDRGRTLRADYGLGPEFRDQYERRFAAINPFARKLGLFQPGVVVTGDQIITREDLKKTEFYREFLSPHEIEHLLCVLLLRDKHFYGFLNLARPCGVRPFNGREATLLQSLVPAIQRALAVNRVLARSASERTVADSLLNSFNRGVVLLDETGRVMTINRSALNILEGRDGLAFEDNGIRAVLPEENLRLKTLLQSAFGEDSSRRPVTDRTMLVSRASAATPLSVLVAPLAKAASPFLEPRARAAVFISDPERCPDCAQGILKGLYGFTEAESRLAVCLMRGFSLEESSAHLGIALNTARTHLKRLFTKTSTNRQGELVHVLLESPATIEMQ
jgi:DNA-binding CsgD family transcriptional regulator/GAF domain-containing protein